MDIKILLDIWGYSTMLKHLPRGGWLMKGIKLPESLADHSYNVAFITMMLGEALKKEKIAEPDMEKAMKMALVHDLAESLITDIPAPMIRFFGSENKHKAEKDALSEIFQNSHLKEELLGYWQEFENRSSVEARIVRAADKIDMMLMVIFYEETGARNLMEFWEDGDRIFMENMKAPEVEKVFYQNIYNQLKSSKPGGDK
jgi:5'-deoxynucleotidase YfbR-like HD superfamily hydrolase